VRLTDFWRAIRDIAFKKYPAEIGEPGPSSSTNSTPILSWRSRKNRSLISAARPATSSSPPPRLKLFFVRWWQPARSHAALSVRARATPRRSYVIRHETTFRNLTNEAAALPHAALSLGTLRSSALMTTAGT